MLASVAAPAQADAEITIEADERTRAAQSVGGSRKLIMTRATQRHPDGAIGYEMVQGEGLSIYRPQDRQQQLARAACGLAVFGLVELEAAKSFFGEDDVGLFTKYRFRILDDWRAGATDNGRTVHVIMPGGALTHGGERYRVVVDVANYQVGSRYVLMAGWQAPGGIAHTIVDLPPFVEVADGLLRPGRLKTPFASGTALTQAKADVADALAQRGCAT